MVNFQVSVRMRIREGMPEGFKEQANECVRRVKQKDTGCLQYDWFLSSDNNECEIRETYVNSEACLATLSNLGDLLKMLYEKFASPQYAIMYGVTSPELLEDAKAKGVEVIKFSFLQGLG